MKRKIRIPIYLVLFCFLTLPFKSCVDSDDYDFDKLSDKVDWQPNFVAPIGYGEYSLWYLLNQHEALDEDKTIIRGDDGLIHIKYTEANIFEYSVDEVLEFPNDDQPEIDVSKDIGTFPNGLPLGGDQSFNVESNFAFETGDSQIILSEVTFGANLNFTISNPINKKIEIKVSLHDLVKNNLIEEKLIDVEISNLSQSFPWNLSGTTLPFVTDDNTKQNTVKIKFEILVKDDGVDVISSGSQLGISYKLQDVDFAEAKGDFGHQTIVVGDDVFDMNVDFWDDIDGNFTFADPRINLEFNNTVGLPFEIKAQMTGTSSDGVSESLNPTSLFPGYPETIDLIDETAVYTDGYNKDNSNIVNFLALPPSGEIKYNGEVVLNREAVDDDDLSLGGKDYEPFAAVNKVNFITKDSKISADMDIDIPLNFKAENLSISDTIDEVDIDNAEKMIKAAIIITAENGLPLDVKIEHIYFTDAAYNVLSAISTESIINAAAVDTKGDVDSASIKKVVNRIELTANQIKSLNDTENIILKLAVSTYDEGGQSVKLKGTDSLKFTLSVNAQLDLTK